MYIYTYTYIYILRRPGSDSRVAPTSSHRQGSSGKNSLEK